MNSALQRAQILIGQQRYDMAAREVGQVLAVEPNNDTAHSLMALCLVELEQFAEATEHAQQAIHLDPSNAHNHYVLAYIWQSRNYLDRAQAAADEAISLDPENPHMHTLMSGILQGQKKWQEGLRYAEKALELDPEDADGINLRAQALRGLGQRQPAGEELRDALKIDPNDASTHANLGWNYLHDGKLDLAKQHFTEALRIDPNLEWARVGAIETIKARNPLYRLVLNYFLWMQRKSAGAQWMILIAAYVIYRIILSQVTARPEWGPVLWPLLIGYILFAISTWFALPLSNFALMLHPFGRRALNRYEKISGAAVGTALTVTLILALVAVARPTSLLIEIAISAAIVTACICMTTLAVPPARKWMLIYTGVVAAMATLSVSAEPVFRLLGEDTESWPAWTVLWSAPTLASIQLMPYALLGAVILVNVLNSVNWKK